MRTQFGVSDGVSNIPMPGEILNEPGIKPLVSQHVAGAMPQHVRMEAWFIFNHF
jgi:hypothetical protein